MSKDLRFKHPFTCIISGTSSSGKLSFYIKFLQNLESLYIEPNFDGGILWCTEKRTHSSLPTSEKVYSFTRVCQKTSQTRELDLFNNP